MQTIGLNFFERGVCALDFNSSVSLICGIGCDDHHRIGIWEVATGVLLAESVCQNGIPPQVKALAWAPALQYTGYISADIQVSLSLYISKT